MTEAMKPYMDKLQSRSLVFGIVGLALTGVGFAVNSQMVLRSYLLAFMLWGGVAIGCLGLLMLHHMVGGGWGVAIRRLLEAGSPAPASSTRRDADSHPGSARGWNGDARQRDRRRQDGHRRVRSVRHQRYGVRLGRHHRRRPLQAPRSVVVRQG